MRATFSIIITLLSINTGFTKEVQKVALYSSAKAVCYDGVVFNLGAKKPMSYNQYYKIASVKCLNHCSKITKKCGVNSFSSGKFVGFFKPIKPIKKPAKYKVVKFQCKKNKKVFKKHDPKCKTQIDWKRLAQKSCKAMGPGFIIKRGELRTYDVHLECKPKKLKPNLQDQLRELGVRVRTITKN